MAGVTGSFELTARLLRARANRYAVIGSGIALFTVAVATVLACAVEFRSVSAAGLLAVQSHNPALWLLDLTPFVFALWGQYTGTVMAYQASALVQDETAELRRRTSALEYQLEHEQSGRPRLGLPNRLALRTLLGQLLARAPGQGRAAVLAIEIDPLRDMDRILGEDLAEDMMRIVTQRLRNILTREQVLAHFGHTEFGLLVADETGADALQQQARRVLRTLDVPVALGGMQISLQAHVGAASTQDEPAIDAESLLRRAEIAKYAARTEHHDFRLYDASLETRHAGRLNLSAELHASLGHEGLEPAFAAQLDLGGGRYRRLRLYPRWPHPRRGLLEEPGFINLPERGGLLHALSLWLLQQGLEWLETWRRRDAALVMAIRLPEQALARLPLDEMLMRLLAAHDLPGESLVLEFSEQALRAADRNAVHAAEALSRHGVRICLRGLGASECSLAALLDFPVAEVRLAGSLIQRAQNENKAALLLEHYLSMVRKLHLVSTAGGVVAHAQLQTLRALGCDWAEGSVVQPLRTPADTGVWLTTAGAVKTQIGPA